MFISLGRWGAGVRGGQDEPGATKVILGGMWGFIIDTGFFSLVSYDGLGLFIMALCR
jgi:hypothetical protein